MIPNAMTCTGPYAGLWSHLKSIDHTIERITHIDSAHKLSELDKDRLIALERFLKSGLKADVSYSKIFESLLSDTISSEPEYTSAIDLRARINTVPEFSNWQKSSKKSYEHKLKRLIDVIDAYLNEPPSFLFSQGEEKEEFVILHSIIHSLLSDAEIAMQH
ncbi:MAG: hypothetical protein KJ687_09225 [Proteobacteria bacterium]|nr:hypothetical protein [Pseudomonadota bacterium]